MPRPNRLRCRLRLRFGLDRIECWSTLADSAAESLAPLSWPIGCQRDMADLASIAKSLVANYACSNGGTTSSANGKAAANQNTAAPSAERSEPPSKKPRVTAKHPPPSPQIVEVLPAGWIGNLEIPRGFEEWGALPPGLSANLPVLQSFLEHFAAAMVRDAVLDGYPGITSDVVAGMQEQLPLVKAETWERFAMRHNYDSHVLPLHPHALRNFVLCPVFRCDRESPLLVASLWAEVSRLAFGHVHNLRLASWILFARRAFHNFPVAWEFLQPWLLERVSAAHFSPKSSCFCDGMRALSQKTYLFGKGSHWFCPDVREVTDGTVHWIDDTISLLQKFWDALPFVLACCQTSGDIDMRSWAVESMLKGVRGISSYAIKFVQGDLLELFKVAGGPHALSLRVFAAVGPALVKAVLRGRLFTAHGEPLGEARVRALGCTLVRFLYHALMTRAAGEGVDAVGSILSSLLVRRHELFGDSRSSVFDLQDVQCKVCTWVMALGNGQWFTSWRGIGVIVCPVLGAVLAKARARKRRRKQKQAAALSFTPAKSAYTGAAG